MNKKRTKDKYNVPCATDSERLLETNLMNVVSGNECTGLMPTPPLGLDEVEAYEEIYDVPLAESRVNTPSEDDEEDEKTR